MDALSANHISFFMAMTKETKKPFLLLLDSNTFPSFFPGNFLFGKESPTN